MPQDDELERLLDPQRLRADHLEVVLWKLVKATGAPLRLTPEALEKFEEHQIETLWELRQQSCPTCGGSGQEGMDMAGLPIACATCEGKGR